jgi:dipeptidyl aminopeptidase/acylaminoacyl peptidase
VQVSNFKGDIGGFKLAPSGDRVVVWADRDLRCADLNCIGLPEKPKGGSGRTYDQLFIRHWDTWAEPGVRSRLFGYTVAGGKLAGAGVPLTGNLVGDVPSKPFGGGEEIAFSPDGRTLFFALREAGRIEAKSTNLDIFQISENGSTAPVNLTDANDATDTLPTVSPDGRTLAYVAMARPTYEADRQVLMLRDLASGRVRPLTQAWDRSVGSIEWAMDGKSLLVTADDTLEHPVFRIDAATGKVTTAHVSQSKTNYDSVVKLGLALVLALIAGMFLLAASIGARRERRRREERSPRQRVATERAPLM